MLKSIIHNNKNLTLGILGGGQLARMLANDAYRLGLNVAIIEKQADSPAGQMTKHEFPNGWEDRTELDKFLEASDIITLENEFIDTNILEYIESKRTLYPSASTMRLTQDKFIQKNTFQNANIPLPAYKKINSIEEGIEFGIKYAYPYVIKTRTLGYDGYGNATVHNETELKNTWEKFHNKNSEVNLMAEEFVNFTKELAVMVVRSKDEYKLYPCVETIQKNHICHKCIAPANIDEEIKLKAQKIALQCVEAIGGIGVFGVELFLIDNGELLVNEIAPRPHNSGHYTIEACYTSQFENCIRAILGLPLGSVDMVQPYAVMINLLGARDGIQVPENVLATLKQNVSLHLYNKNASRVGRKMGHITAIGTSFDEANNSAKDAFESLEW